MTIKEFLDHTNLERCLLIGYYGGGNFGDELLLEVLQHQLHARNVRQVRFVYSRPDRYRTYHHDFGYQPVSGITALAKAVFSSRSLVVGGGGLWGLDVNFNIFVMSTLLFVARYLLGKRVYLIGVGYYGSTGRLGRLSAWLAGKSAHHIIARDPETATNFGRLSRHVSTDRDLAFLIEDIDLSPYAAEIPLKRPVEPGSVFISLRHFRKDTGFNKSIEHLLGAIPDRKVFLVLLQPSADYPAGQRFIESAAKHYSNVSVLDTTINPLALVHFFAQNRSQLRFITPQFHAIIAAMFLGIPFAPIAYDNKVTQLLVQNGAKEAIPMSKITPDYLVRSVGGET